MPATLPIKIILDRLFGGIFLKANLPANPPLSSCPYPHQLLSTISTTSNTLDTQLLNLNTQFLQEHQRALQLTSADIDIVIIYKGDELSLWKKIGNTYDQLENIVPTADQRYTRLKQIAHLPVLITILLDQLLIQKVFSINSLANLQEMRTKILLITQHIGEMSPSDIEVQTVILQNTKELIELILSAEQPIDQGKLIQLKRTYIDSIKASLAYNSKTAAKVQLTGLNKLMAYWQTIHHIQPEKSRVIIVSPHGPKVDRIEIQYFTRWYQEKLGIDIVENKMLYSIEELPTKIAALDCKKDLIAGFLLGSELNKTIGEQLLGNNDAMFADILKSYASPVLKKMF